MSLSDGLVGIHKLVLPSEQPLQKIDIELSIDYILDFEPYKISHKEYKHFVAMLYWDPGNT